MVTMVIKFLTFIVLFSTPFSVFSALLDFPTCVQQVSRTGSSQGRLSSDLIIAICKEKVAKANRLENDFGSLIPEKWVDIEEIRESDGSFTQLRVTNNTTDKTVRYIRLQCSETKADTKYVWTEKTGEYYFFKINVRPGVSAILLLPEKYLKFSHFKAFSIGASSNLLDRINTSQKVLPLSSDPFDGINLE